MVIGVGHHDLLLLAEAEAVRGVELPLARAQGPELASHLHHVDLKRFVKFSLLSHQ